MESEQDVLSASPTTSLAVSMKPSCLSSYAFKSANSAAPPTACSIASMESIRQYTIGRKFSRTAFALLAFDDPEPVPSVKAMQIRSIEQSLDGIFT